MKMKSKWNIVCHIHGVLSLFVCRDHLPLPGVKHSESFLRTRNLRNMWWCATYPMHSPPLSKRPLSLESASIAPAKRYPLSLSLFSLFLFLFLLSFSLSFSLESAALYDISL